MDKTQWENTLLQKLADELEELNLDWQMREEQGVKVLRSMYRPKEEATVVLDMLFASLEQQQPVLQLYFYIADGMGRRKRPELLELVKEINFHLPIGAFGVYDELEQLYYKQGILFAAQADLQQAVEQTISSTELMLLVIRQHFDDLAALCE